MRLSITLNQSEREALLALAENERRDLRQQAAFLIRRELEREGYLQPLAESADQSNDRQREREVSCGE